MTSRVAYFDNHATTPVDPRVMQKMLPFFTEHFGNAASRSHAAGWFANEAVELARQQVARAVRGDAKGVIFTSGATEAVQLALLGATRARPERKHLVTLATEHAAVLETHAWLEREGVSTTYVPVQPNGLVDPDVFSRALRPETALASAMWVNNEIGVVQPIAELARRARAVGAWFFSDASQALGRVEVLAADVDLLALSAHKAYGPKGVGALWSNRDEVELDPVTVGGGHERGLRAGTPNVPGIVGFGAAAELSIMERAADEQRFVRWRDQLVDSIGSSGHLNGTLVERVAGNLNFSFADLRGEALLGELRAFALSSGAACASASLEPSHVLQALGRSPELAHASLRIGLGRFNTDAEVDALTRAVPEAIHRLRAARI